MPPPKPRLSGPKARFRGKVRGRVISLTLTPEGHVALARGLAATGLSRGDYIEAVLRRAARRHRTSSPA